MYTYTHTYLLYTYTYITRRIYATTISVAGVSWEEVLEPLEHISLLWVTIFLVYIQFTYFAVRLDQQLSHDQQLLTPGAPSK